MSKIHGLWPIANEDSSDSINGKLMGMGAMWLFSAVRRVGWVFVLPDANLSVRLRLHLNVYIDCSRPLANEVPEDPTTVSLSPASIVPVLLHSYLFVSE
jgi:hypothetical protein